MLTLGYRANSRSVISSQAWIPISKIVFGVMQYNRLKSLLTSAQMCLKYKDVLRSLLLRQFIMLIQHLNHMYLYANLRLLNCHRIKCKRSKRHGLTVIARGNNEHYMQRDDCTDPNIGRPETKNLYIGILWERRRKHSYCNLKTCAAVIRGVFISF
jgi:hypothetical protein